MLIQRNNFFKDLAKMSRILFLLIFFQTLAFSSFQSIYYMNSPSVSYSIENGNYRVYIKESRYISQNKDGFKLYLPNFLKSYNLEILREGSLGSISGYLSRSTTPSYKNIVKNFNVNDLKYYISDFTKNQKNQLTYLLKAKVIPYENFTSLSIEANNIPKFINKRLNKWIYFTFDKSKTSFTNLVYSYSMILDKKSIDTYIKNHFKILEYRDNKYNKIHTYLMNLNQKSFIKKELSKVVISKKIVKKPKKSKKKSTLHPYSLDITRVNEMIALNNSNSLNNKAITLYKKKKYLKSSKLLEKALFQSDKSSINILYYNLGIIHSKINTKQSNKIAIDYFRKSELKEAYFNLGIYNYIGLVLKEDDKKAYKYFKLSSKKGFKRAQYNIKIMEKYKIGLR